MSVPRSRHGEHPECTVCGASLATDIALGDCQERIRQLHRVLERLMGVSHAVVGLAVDLAMVAEGVHRDEVVS